MVFLENIKIALNTIRENLLRSILTLFIIALGIGCLVGIMTAIDNLLFSLNDSFSGIGANSFNIEKVEQRSGKRRGKVVKSGPVITSQQVKMFKKNYTFPGSKVSTNVYATSTAVEYNNKKTAPSVRVRGIDDNYLAINSIELTVGRGFSPVELSNGNNIAIIGKDIVKELFDDVDERALNKKVLVKGIPYLVAGVLESKGASFGGSADNTILIPLLNAKINFGYSNMNYDLTVAVQNPVYIDEATSAAIGTMRNIRKLTAGEGNDFEIKKSDGLLQTLKDQTATIRIATIVIAALTILGAAIGLMNIMLVSVTERTKEIGVRKALGATSKNILTQFLTEAIVICILGGIVGIIFGIGLGYAVSFLIKGTFVMPWAWMLLGIIVCIITGILSGLLPAMKAANLDPIESLRKE